MDFKISLEKSIRYLTLIIIPIGIISIGILWKYPSRVEACFSGNCLQSTPECVLNISKEVDRSSANPGDTLIYTLNFSNVGTADCTGGGVKVRDVLSDKLAFIDEMHSDNVSAGYNDEPLYDESQRRLRWNAHELNPGESGFVKIKATINTPGNCGNFDISNKGHITSWEYSNFNELVYSNEVRTSVNNSCPTPTPTPTPTAAPTPTPTPTPTPQPPTVVIVAVTPPVPVIHIVKTPVPATLPIGGGSVTYNYTVTNPGYYIDPKVIAIYNVDLTDDKCSPISFVSGDENNNNKLDTTETWKYTCTANLAATTTNTVTVTGTANNTPVSDTAVATVNVGPAPTPTPTPISGFPIAIKLVKKASVATLPASGGSVQYTYTVINPGVNPLSDVTLTDDKCSSISFVGGDANNDSKLDPSETWKYDCKVFVDKTTTNTAVARGRVGGQTATDISQATVVVKAPVVPGKPPKTGGEGLPQAVPQILTLGAAMIVFTQSKRFFKKKA